MKKILKGQEGYALFLALLALLLLTVLGLSLMTISTNTMNYSVSERGNQSSFYIAEAGLTAKRVEIEKLVEEAFQKTQQQFEALRTPQEKARFDFEESYRQNVQTSLQGHLSVEETKSYEPQNGEIPESKTRLSLVSTDPLVYSIQSIGNVPLSTGRVQTKEVSQVFEIQLAVDKNTVTETVKGETIAKIKACFSLYTTGDLYHNTNSLKGPIYVNGTTFIQRGGAYINGNTYSVGDVRISGGGSGINGDVYTGGKVIITAGGSKVNGRVYENTPVNQVKNECVQELPQLPNVASMFPDPNISPLANAKNQSGQTIVQSGTLSLNSQALNNSVWRLSEDTYLTRLHIPSNRNLYIDMQNQDRTLFVDDLDIQNGSIHLLNANSSKLKMIVKSKFTFSNGDLNKNGKTDSIDVYYAGSTTPSLGGNSIYNADFHILKSDLTVSGSNGISGDLIHYGTGNKITVSGNGNMGNRLVLAPNSDFFLTGSGSISGNIIARNFTASGSGSIAPATDDSGEWEYTEGNTEVIEYVEYQDEGSLIKTEPISEE